MNVLTVIYYLSYLASLLKSGFFSSHFDSSHAIEDVLTNILFVKSYISNKNKFLDLNI